MDRRALLLKVAPGTLVQNPRNEVPPNAFDDAPHNFSEDRVVPGNMSHGMLMLMLMLRRQHQYQPVPLQIKKVPGWLYDECVCGRLHKAAFLWFSNLVCAFFHLGLACITIWGSMRNGKGLDTPRLTLYITNLTWVPNATNSLVPKNEPITGLYLAHATLWFFLLSFLAHFTVVVLNYRQAFGACNLCARRVTAWTGWYFTNIHKCRNPLR